MLTEEEEMLIIQRLHSVLRPFLLRRTKAMVLADLPQKHQVVIWVPLSSWQRTLYLSGLRRVHRLSADQEEMGDDRTVPASVMGLRKALNHPYHFLKGEAVITSKEENLIRASGKFEFLDRMLPRLRRFGHKVLIFAQMTSALDLLQELLARHQLRYQRIDGSMTGGRRREAMNIFRMEPELGVLLLTTRAGGLGLNLQVADTVILFDSDWNPQVDAQAMDRAHRIGQQRPVLVIRLMTPTALDRGLWARSCGKLEMERKVISAGNFHHEPCADSQSYSLQQLVHETRLAAGAPAVGSGATPLPEVSRLLARSPEEHADFDAGDDALLGPALGLAEDAADRLERGGRLMQAWEVPSMPRKSRILPPRKRRRTKMVASRH